MQLNTFGALTVISTDVTAAVFVLRTWNAKTKVAKHNFSSADILRVFTVISHNRLHSFNICTNIIVVEVKGWCSRPPISSNSTTLLKKTLYSLGHTKKNNPFNAKRVNPMENATVPNITLCLHDSETMLLISTCFILSICGKWKWAKSLFWAIWGSPNRVLELVIPKLSFQKTYPTPHSNLMMSK